MQLPKGVESAIQLASIRASHIFHACGWEWVGVGIPSSVQIQDIYTMLAQNVMALSNELGSSGERMNCGTAMNGRLVVDLTDGIWTFTVIMADYVED